MAEERQRRGGEARGPAPGVSVVRRGIDQRHQGRSSGGDCLRRWGWALAGLVSVTTPVAAAHAADEPEPEPVPESPPIEREERKVLLGPDIGYTLLLPRGDAPVSFEAGFTWGGHARVEVLDWLGVRLSARNSRHAVDLAPGALRTPDAGVLDGVALEHPPLDIWTLGARLEPTWVATPRLRLWGGLGVGWARIETGEVEARLSECSEQCDLHTEQRRGSASELDVALGSTYDVIPRWVAASLEVSGAGFVGPQVGSLFREDEPMQAFVDGSMLHVAALPELGSAWALRLSVDLVF